MKTHFIRSFGVAILIVASVVISGCASPANKESMSAVPTAAIKKLPYTVTIQTNGGAETGAMDSSNVSNTDLKSALESSITSSGLFKGIVENNGADFTLSVTVTQLAKPMFGGAFTVTMEAGWTLMRNSDKTIAMRKAVRSSHTATMSDAFVGVTRLRLAVEGAVRNNISQGLQEISQLPI